MMGLKKQVKFKKDILEDALEFTKEALELCSQGENPVADNRERQEACVHAGLSAPQGCLYKLNFNIKDMGC